MAYLKDGTVVSPGLKETRSGPDLPMREYQVQSTDRGCDLFVWHNIEKRRVAELPVGGNLDANDLLRLLGHHLARGVEVIDPRLNIVRRKDKVSFETPAGKFAMDASDAMKFWMEWGTRAYD